jgi:hypothetical protein
LHGVTEKTAAELAPLGRSWLRAPKLGLTVENFISQGYDQAERAYVLNCKQTGESSKLELTLEASEERPIVNPAFVIEGWGCAGAAVRINGSRLRPGKDFRFGHRRGLESTDLIVWIQRDSVKPIRIELAPAEG